MGNVVTLEDGMEAPLFSAEDSAGNVWNLSDLLAEGKRVSCTSIPKIPLLDAPSKLVIFETIWEC